MDKEISINIKDGFLSVEIKKEYKNADGYDFGAWRFKEELFRPALYALGFSKKEIEKEIGEELKG